MFDRTCKYMEHVGSELFTINNSVAPRLLFFYYSSRYASQAKFLWYISFYNYVKYLGFLECGEKYKLSQPQKNI